MACRSPQQDTAPSTTALADGTPLKQIGCVHSGMLGGWVSDLRTGLPMLVTVAHLLRPRPEIFARSAAAPPLPPVFTLDGPYLCTAADPSAVAQVVRMGVSNPGRQPASLDVAVAVPLTSALVPRNGWESRHAPARVGQRAVIAGAPPGAGLGKVVAVGWRSGHYGSRDDILVAPVDGETFSHPGMSGAWVLDDTTGLPIGMLVGDMAGAPQPGLSGLRLACLHPIANILELFEVTLA